MPDHIHVLVSPLEKSIPKWVNGFKAHVTRTLGTSDLWQPSYFDRALRNDAEFDDVLRYIVANPGAAGLDDDAGEWPWVFVAGDG